MTQRVLAIVPARGGSKTIPRKNVRILHGQPLIWHVLRTLQASHLNLTIYVSTDDDEIEDAALRIGVPVVRRPKELADNRTPLDPVIHHAVAEVEARTQTRFAIVATIQPTSPLLSLATLHKTIGAIADDDYDTAITVSDDRHLRWGSRDGQPVPLFSQRLNRQQLPPEYRETGAVLATKREFVSSSSRFGRRVRLVPVPPPEAVDIDTYADWWLADNYLASRRIAIRVDGGAALGLGHVYRALTLTSRLYNHEIRFFMDPAFPDGLALAEGFGAEIQACDRPEAFQNAVDTFRPALVILDILDTSRETVEWLQRRGCFVVTFEDLGTGADAADLVFNALYRDPHADDDRRHCGPGYVCLREEFYTLPNHRTRRVVEQILVTFGGTDPNDLTAKTLQALARLPDCVHVTAVLGLGYRKHEDLHRVIGKLERPITVVQNVRNISRYMLNADIAVTSAGRTVFELMACQTPTIVLAQNERELLHTSADERFGVTNLGLGSEASTSEILAAVEHLLPIERRVARRDRMLLLDLWHGPERIVQKIFTALDARERQRRAQVSVPGRRRSK